MTAQPRSQTRASEVERLLEHCDHMAGVTRGDAAIRREHDLWVALAGSIREYLGQARPTAHETGSLFDDSG